MPLVHLAIEKTAFWEASGPAPGRSVAHSENVVGIAVGRRGRTLASVIS